MEERRQGQEARKDEARPCATPRENGLDHCEKSGPLNCSSSRERSLTKAPEKATRRSFWTGYTPRPAAEKVLGLPGEHEEKGIELIEEKSHDKSSSTRESVSESV